MAFSKSNKFSPEDHAIAAFAKAICHASRPSILRKLAKKSPTKALSILKNHPISQPAVSQHLEILRKPTWLNALRNFHLLTMNWIGRPLKLWKKCWKSFWRNLKNNSQKSHSSAWCKIFLITTGGCFKNCQFHAWKPL